MAIWELEKYRKLQGTFPVIFISFKSCKDSSWDKIYDVMIDVIAEEFNRHFEQLKPILASYELKEYTDILDGSASYSRYASSLLFLSRLLQRLHKKNVIVLVDDYDVPIHAGYVHGFYTSVAEFMGSLLVNVFKDNNILKRGILTGVLCVPKAGIFSGLNNLRVFTLLDRKFEDKFGFTEQEVGHLLAKVRLLKKSDVLKQWYSGYKFGSVTIYNPLSLLECINNKGHLEPYWKNTSANALLKKLIEQADSLIKLALGDLLKGSFVVEEIENALIFPGIENNHKALWSLLLFAGYLTFETATLSDGTVRCRLVLPNEEIKLLYSQLIKNIFEQSLGVGNVLRLVDAFERLDGEQLDDMFRKFMLSSMSSFDITDDDPEISCHMFGLGLLVVLGDTYEVHSNKESGYGRYDIFLIPKNKKKRGIVIEFKKVTSSDKTLEVAASRALGQIVHKDYAQVLKDRGIRTIGAFGIACKGKKILVKTAELD